VDLGAPDVGASTVFYGAVLGWEFVDTGEGFGHYHIGQVDGHAAAAIGPKQDPNQPTAWTVYLASGDAATTGGGTLLGEPMDTPFGRMAFVTDPDSAVFAVAGPPPTA
jgi:hypothetical protein